MQSHSTAVVVNSLTQTTTTPVKKTVGAKWLYHKRFEAFKIVKTIPLSEIRAHNEIHLAQKIPKKTPKKNSLRDTYFWYIKKEPNKKTAVREVIAQELTRLVMFKRNPNFPKTRLLIDKDGNYYVASKMIEGFIAYNDLPPESKIAFREGRYPCLGIVLAAAIFTNEIDLNGTNIGIDAKGNVVKIDGGACFPKHFCSISSQPKSTWDITATILDNLPDPTNYYAFNWLNFYEYNRAANRVIHNPKNAKTWLDVSDKNYIPFKNEVYQTSLAFALMTPNFIRLFSDYSIKNPEEYNEQYAELLSRIELEKKSLIEGEAGNNYLYANTITKNVIEIVTAFKELKLMNNRHLWAELDSAEEETIIQTLLKELQAKARENIERRDREKMLSDSYNNSYPPCLYEIEEVEEKIPDDQSSSNPTLTLTTKSTTTTPLHSVVPAVVPVNLPRSNTFFAPQDSLRHVATMNTKKKNENENENSACSRCTIS